MAVITRILTASVLFYLALCMDIPAPVHLDLSSQNFVHLLSWRKGPGSPDDVHYTVRVFTLSGSVVDVKACERVTNPLQCNLTESLSDVEETYYISVSASLGRHKSPYSHCSPFKPIYNTTLEPPLLSITICNQSLCVNLRAPSEKLYSSYDSFKLHYRLMVSSEDGTEFPVETEGLKSITLRELASGRRYCVTVSIIDRSPPNRPPVCASTPKTANISDAVISVILCLLMVLLVMCTPRLYSHRFCLKADLPEVLRSFQRGNEVLLITSREHINMLFEERDSIQKIEINRQEKEVEGEEEEGVTYDRLVAHYLHSQASSFSVYPVSSSCDLLMNQGPETHLTSSTDVQSCHLNEHEGSHVHATEQTVTPKLKCLPQGTSPLQNLSSILQVPTQLEEEDRESSTDVNLFSVLLGGFSAEKHRADPDKTCSTKDELGSNSQNLFQTADTSTWPSDVQSEDEEDEYSGYLSQN